MKFPKPIPVKQLARKWNARLIGDDSLQASGINEIHKVEVGDITFSDVKKYFRRSIESAASIILLNEEAECPPGKAILVVDDPFSAYDGLIREYRPFEPFRQSISDQAEIHPSVIIEPNVVIGPHVSIGEGSYIRANTTIGSHVCIGRNVIIEPNCIIASDAFYFKKHPDRFQKWRTGGRVIIEDDVFIGAGCSISKGVSGDTVIGRGSKLDCQIHLGHGVVIGRNCLFAAQVGIGGKTIIGDNVILYGQVGITQNLKIGDDVVVLAQSGVGKDLEGGKVYFGSPCKEAKAAYRELASLKQLPEIIRKWHKSEKD